jgi:homopolymeric O-antigen transport system ATP-binding protein
MRWGLCGLKRPVKALLMCSDQLITLQDVSKCYPVFTKPRDRLKQMLVPRLARMLMPWSSKPPAKFYEEFWALRNISFDIKRGEAVAIIGRNGSGKSTLLQIVCGILQVDSGSVALNGRIAALLELGAGFNPEFTGRENVYMNAAILGLTEAEIDERFDDIVAFSEIGEFIERPVKTYSSGMFMRLAFSIATSVDPDVVVVDEALSVGDIGFSMKCMQRIEEMRERGVTILLVTHDMGLVRSMCARAIYLKAGECMFDGDAETATELFLMDVRGEQAAMLEQKMSFQEALNKDGMAFGTGAGKLLAVKLSCGAEARTWFKHGEIIDLDLEAWLSDALRVPTLAIAIRDAKGIVIAGFDSRRLEAPLLRNKDGHVFCRFSFKAQLLPGIYNVAVRILDFPYGASDVLIEKQLSAITLEIVSDPAVSQGNYGFVSLNGECEQLPLAQRVASTS